MYQRLSSELDKALLASVALDHPVYLTLPVTNSLFHCLSYVSSRGYRTGKIASTTVAGAPAFIPVDRDAEAEKLKITLANSCDLPSSLDRPEITVGQQWLQANTDLATTMTSDELKAIIAGKAGEIKSAIPGSLLPAVALAYIAEQQAIQIDVVDGQGKLLQRTVAPKGDIESSPENYRVILWQQPLSYCLLGSLGDDKVMRTQFPLAS